jgi:hypothetical protein
MLVCKACQRADSEHDVKTAETVPGAGGNAAIRWEWHSELGDIIGAMVASARLTLGGFLARFVFAVLVVGATYNPTPYSYYAWVQSIGYEWRPPTVFVGVVLLIGWFICLRLALRSMGGLGLLLANAFLAALYWLMTSWGWLPGSNIVAISWLALFSIAGILAIGMSWTRWRRGSAAPQG